MAERRLVRDWMTPNPIAVTPETSLPEARQIMVDKGVRRLPVMDGDRLVGIVTRGDVRGAQASEATSLSIWELNYLINKLRIDEVMSKKVITVSSDSPMRDAAQTMLENKIAGLPVVDDGKLVGMITESDIFRMLVESWD